MQDYPLILDTAQTGIQQTVTGFYCADSGEKRLCITLLHNSAVYTPQAGTLALCGKKPDGTRFLHPCSASGSQVYYLPTAQTLAVPGTVECQLIVYGENGSVLFAPQFAIEVDEPLQPQEGLVSADEWSLLPIGILSALSAENGSLLLNGDFVGTVILAQTFADLPAGISGQTAYVRTEDADHACGFYRFTTRWEYLSVADHTHDNKAIIDALHVENGQLYLGSQPIGILTTMSSVLLPADAPVGAMAYVGSERSLYCKEQDSWHIVYNGMQMHTHTNKSTLDLVTQDVVSNSHAHENAAVLDRFGDQNGKPTYNGEALAKQADVDGNRDTIAEIYTPDTLVPLELGTTYAELIVRPDFQDVPVYITGGNPVVCRLESDTLIDGFAESEIRLMYLVDYQTGMPLPVLAVSSGGQYCVYFPDTFHDLGETLLPGWYDVNNDPLSEPPTFTDMTFDSLIIGNGTPITDLSDLSGEALCALETLSRMVNVSADAMGGLGVKTDGVQRLNNVPVPGRRYAAVTSRNMTFPLPSITWTGKERDFWVDLDCTSSVDLTFSDNVSYEDGNNIDTTRGRHRLHFYAPAGASVWTVAETESYTEITEDILPERPTPFRSLTADELRAVLKFGYSNTDGDWCIRREGVEEVWLQVGDTRSVTLTDGQEVTMRIIGIQHDDLPGGGKAALTCDFVELINITTVTAHQNSLYDAWARRSNVKSIASLFPSWLYALSVCAKKPCCQVRTGDFSYVQHSEIYTDITWLLSMSEVGVAPNETPQDGYPYPLFTDNSSRMRYDQNSVRQGWILRTGRTDSRTNLYVTDGGELVSASGGIHYNDPLSVVAVGFCLNA